VSVGTAVIGLRPTARGSVIHAVTGLRPTARGASRRADRPYGTADRR